MKPIAYNPSQNASSAFKVSRGLNESSSSLIIKTPDDSPLKVGYTKDHFTVTHDDQTIKIPSKYPIFPYFEDIGFGEEVMSDGDECNGVVITQSKYDTVLHVDLLTDSQGHIPTLTSVGGYSYLMSDGSLYPQN